MGDRHLKFHRDRDNLLHTDELATNHLILTHMGPSMLSRLDEIEQTTAGDGLTLQA